MRKQIFKFLMPGKLKKRKRRKFLRNLFVGLTILLLVPLGYIVHGVVNASSGALANNEIEILKNEIKELREYLLLPPKEGESQDDIELALFEVLAENKKEIDIEKLKEENQEALENVLESEKIQNFEVQNLTNQVYTIEDILEFGVAGDRLYIRTPIKQIDSTPATFREDIAPYLREEKLEFLAEKANEINEKVTQLNDIKFNESISEKLDNHNLRIEGSNLILSRHEAKILRVDDAVVGKLVYDIKQNKFYLEDADANMVSAELDKSPELLSSLETYLTVNTFPTFLEQQIESQITEVKEIVNSEHFQAALAESDLKSKPIVEETNDYRIEIISSQTAEQFMSILINKATAEVSIEQNGVRTPLTGTPDLDELQTNNLKKNSGELNILVAGKHGSLTDTIILANINESKEKVNLVSIPRDLFVDQKKINSIYMYSGMPELVKEVEQLTGTAIDNYVMIDMYAFIEVVDYMGGIDVTLEEALIDPTYKTFDDGKWGTLYYPAGEHHLSGKQALRLARSRHYSSDFDRAKRQHLILEALQEKSTHLSIKNAGTLINITGTLLSKTDTNLTPNSAVKYFFKYKDYDISGRNVLSTANVLTSTYAKTFKLANGAERQICEDCKGMYILLPRDNDWGLIKSYVRSVFSS